LNADRNARFSGIPAAVPARCHLGYGKRKARWINKAPERVTASVCSGLIKDRIFSRQPPKMNKAPWFPRMIMVKAHKMRTARLIRQIMP